MAQSERNESFEHLTFDNESWKANWFEIGIHFKYAWAQNLVLITSITDFEWRSNRFTSVWMILLFNSLLNGLNLPASWIGLPNVPIYARDKYWSPTHLCTQIFVTRQMAHYWQELAWNCMSSNLDKTIDQGIYPNLSLDVLR